MSRCLLDSCCYFATLEIGCYILGILTFVEGSIFLLGTSTIFSISLEYDKENKNQCSNNSRHCQEDLESPHSVPALAVFYSLFGTVILICLIWILASLLLIVGVQKKRYRMMKPWVAGTIFVILICLFNYVTPLLFIIIYKVYSCWVVVSYIAKLKEQEVRQQINDIEEEGIQMQVRHRQPNLQALPQHMQTRAIDQSAAYMSVRNVGLSDGSTYMTVLLPQENPSGVIDRRKPYDTPPPTYTSTISQQNSVVTDIPSTSSFRAPSIDTRTTPVVLLNPARPVTPPPSYEDAISSPPVVLPIAVQGSSSSSTNNRVGEIQERSNENTEGEMSRSDNNAAQEMEQNNCNKCD